VMSIFKEEAQAPGPGPGPERVRWRQRNGRANQDGASTAHSAGERGCRCSAMSRLIELRSALPLCARSGAEQRELRPLV
jgi:hypothetical protein